jgi:hypothetical protein
MLTVTRVAMMTVSGRLVTGGNDSDSTCVAVDQYCSSARVA